MQLHIPLLIVTTHCYLQAAQSERVAKSLLQADAADVDQAAWTLVLGTVANANKRSLLLKRSHLKHEDIALLSAAHATAVVCLRLLHKTLQSIEREAIQSTKIAVINHATKLKIFSLPALVL